MLRQLIQDSNLGPGERLPPERSLAEQLQVGRPAVREGIKALCILDVLESRRGDGTYVKSLKALQADWPASLEVMDTEFNALDLLEVRKMLEPKAARLAATRANETQLRNIEQEHAAIEECQKWVKIARHDFLLHAAIIEAAGNPILTKLIRALNPLLRQSREVTASRAPDRTRMLKDHRAIVAAIVRGEAEQAERAMLEHLHNVGLDLISSRSR
jgi:GntR family transcriptional repressor for pyruvate dehydrogenase complex